MVFRPIKCLDMAIKGEWWTKIDDISQLSDSHIATYAAQVIEDIENGKIE